MLAVYWKMWITKSKEKVQKQDLLDYRCRDLELEAQYKDVRRQLDAYDRSRDPEVRGKWNRICSECGYINHERHRFCESCGCTLKEEVLEVVHVCPRCGTALAKRSRECHECGVSFWSTAIVRVSDEDPQDASHHKDSALR